MKKFVVSVFAVLLVFGFAITDAKASLVYELGSLINGTSPTSTPPWLTATFTTVGSGGEVTLTLQSNLNVASEFYANTVAFNVNPSITPSSLTIAQVTAVDANIPATSISATTDNAQTVNGAGTKGTGFDILFNYPSAGSGPRFNDFDLITYTITGTNLTEADFANTNSSGLPILAHVQGIPAPGGGTTSGAVSVPIPAAAWLLGSGLLGIIGISRRLRKK